MMARKRKEVTAESQLLLGHVFVCTAAEAFVYLEPRRAISTFIQAFISAPYKKTLCWCLR